MGTHNSIYIGESVARVDGVGKVTGEAKFAEDYNDESLNLYVYCSSLPHATIQKIETAKSLEVPGVYTIIQAHDIPGDGLLGPITKDRPLLATEKIRYYGEPIALVVAENRQAAEDAFSKIEVKAKPLPTLLNPSQALATDATRIHKKGNLLKEFLLEKGSIQEAEKRAQISIKNTYKTAMNEHAYLEPDAGVGEYDSSGVLVVKVATQIPHEVRKDIAQVLDLPLNRVRVIQAVTGGGFGGKLDSMVPIFIALAVYKTKKRIKMVLSREEVTLTSTKRHPFLIEYHSYASKDGLLLGVDATIYADTGAYSSYGEATLKRAIIHATGPYRVENIRVKGFLVYTNKQPAGAMRGFGTPQITFASESQIDMISKEAGLSPREMRTKNCLREMDETGTGQVLEQSVGIYETLEEAQAFSLKIKSEEEKEKEKREKEKKGKEKEEKEKQEETTICEGIGWSCMWYGIGKTGIVNPSTVFVEILHDGSAILLTGAADIGQGSSTVFAQIVAQELGIEYDKVQVVSGDTQTTPDSGVTSASRQTYVTGKAVQLACQQAKELIMREIEEYLETPIHAIEREGEEYSTQHKRITWTEAVRRCQKRGLLTSSKGYFNPEMTKLDDKCQGIPYPTYSFGTQVAFVEVDRETGLVKVKRIIAVHDVGRAIHPLNIEGQIEGGSIMGLGQGLLEEVLFEEGRLKNPEFKEYLIPTSLDAPDVLTGIVEKHEETGPFYAKGVGESPSVPTAAAIANAVYDAIGVRITSYPITPERLLKGLDEVESSSRE